MTKYKRIDESDWNIFGKNLLNNKGSDEQIKFLQACRNGKNDFIKYLDEKLLQDKEAIIEGNSVDFNHKFTEAEFIFPPKDTQAIIWRALGEITRENESSCGFWGYVIIQMIQNDCITPDYLASDYIDANKSNLDDWETGGLYMLDIAIKSDNEKEIDTCVRKILRSMGNPAPRGKRAIFLKIFPLGQTYWRWHWANKMSKKIDLSFEEILTIFDETSYEIFAENMHSKNSYISQINTLGGLLLFLNENNLKEEKLKNVIKTISYLSAWKAIEIQSPELNKKEIALIFDELYPSSQTKIKRIVKKFTL